MTLAEVTTDRAVFADIRATLGIPVVNLVYRHLATEPGRLERVWAQVGPNLRDARVQADADALEAAAGLALEPLPATAVAAIGADTAAVRRVLSVYARGNARNLIAVHALLDGVTGHHAGAGASSSSGTPAPARTELPQMADPAGLPPAQRALLLEMSAAIAPGEPRLVPSLLRHLTQPPALLALLWTALRAPLRSLDADPLRRRAAAAAARAPEPVAPVEDAGTRDVLGRFAEAIARMLLVGAAIGAALAEVAE